MQFSDKFKSKSFPTFAQNGMVATSQALASQVGLDMLKRGGNAVDAAVAAAACLTVVEPPSNGIGGDAFAIVWMNNEMYGLNASGKSPESISIEAVKQLGYEKMPAHGLIPVTVPGAPGAWAALLEKFGKLTLEEVLEPAIHYAEKGFPVSTMTAELWQMQYNNYKNDLKDDLFSEWFTVFAPKGQAPKAGEIWRSLDHAKTLKEIAKTNGNSFYYGEIAEKISKFSQENGGFLQYDDLANFEVEWVRPMKVNYRGYDIWELPPNGLGIITLMALNIIKGFTFEKRNDVETFHKQMEAIKLAFADGLAFITDEKFMVHNPHSFIDSTYGSLRRSLITDQATVFTSGKPRAGGTVYLATADSEGNMASFIQSNYRGFGSGLVVPGTGIALQNRGVHFSLNPNDLNALKGGKKTYHTIIPGFITKENKAIGPFGVMGGLMQPQGQLQVLMNMIDFQMNPQLALDLPRWRWLEQNDIQIEEQFPDEIAKQLIQRGHQISIQPNTSRFGFGQIICRDQATGVYIGGTDSRTDGIIASW